MFLLQYERKCHSIKEDFCLVIWVMYVFLRLYIIKAYMFDVTCEIWNLHDMVDLVDMEYCLLLTA